MIMKLLLIAGLIFMSGDLLAKKVNGKTVPIHGAFQGYLLGFNEDSEDIAARCNPPDGKFAWAITSFEGWGTVSHLGESYFHAEHCSYGIVDVGPDGTYGEGIVTTIADNGDILMGTYTNGLSLSPPPMAGFMDYVTFENGGTGRFRFASGGGIEMGMLDFNDLSLTMQMNGVIAYSKK